ATYRGRALGTIGDVGAFSLQLEKNVTAGEGGVVVTDDERLYQRAARYQDQGGQFFTSHSGGRGHDLAEPFVGENLRMTELAAAIAGVQFEKLPRLLDTMRSNKARIVSAVGAVDGLERRRVPDPTGDGSSSITWFAPTPSLATRFVAALRAEGIPSAQMYGGQPVYATAAILERRTASGKGGPWHCAEHPTQVEYRMGLCPTSEALAARAAVPGGDIVDDWRDVVGRDDVDAVDICTPNVLHAPIAVAAASAGKHVLVEKPIACTLAEADDMLAAARAAGVLLMTAHNVRFFPAFVAAREAVAAGAIGGVTAVRAAFGHAGPQSWSPTSDWFSDPAQPGG